MNGCDVLYRLREVTRAKQSISSRATPPYEKALSHKKVKPDLECINRFPLFGQVERVLGPPMQKWYSLRVQEVWLRRRIFWQIFFAIFPQFSPQFPTIFFCNFPQLDWTLPDRNPPPPCPWWCPSLMCSR